EKHHCTFCGLNGLGMGFRSKSPERIRSELSELASRHRITFFEATDNILDMRHVQSLLGAIAESREDYRFFYEIKANLTQPQIRALHRGGVRWVQPGIESLNTHVLTLMHKGATMLQNVRLLKWCRYYNIRVSWNLIWGFPGETEDDYTAELDVLHSLTHLEPAHACTRIWLERFSPYFTDRHTYPLHTLHAEASYHHAYPITNLNHDKIAYFFDYQMDNTLPDSAHTNTQTFITNWQTRYHSNHRETLTYRRTSDSILIDDTRHNTPTGTTEYHGPLARAYEYCTDTMRTPTQIATHLNHTVTPDEIRQAFTHPCQHRFMLTENDRYLALALPTNPNW
ncbi:RiPP maturation radical SAM C-methyltransferase, partial [Solirubrobacter ginsenosidimutans]